MLLEPKFLDTLHDNFKDIRIDSYLRENQNMLFELFYEVAKVLHPANQNALPLLKTHFSKKETLRLEEEFLASLHPRYSKQFRQDLVEGNLFPTDEDDYHYVRNGTTYQIYYPKQSTLIDFAVLSHEYIHHLSSKFPELVENTSAYTVYCQQLAIFAELKCLDFLKELGIAKDDVELYKYYINARHYNNIAAFLTIQPLLELYLSNHVFSEEKLEELFTVNSFYNALGRQDAIHNFHALTRNSYQKCLHYQHPLGMFLAASLHQADISNQEFVFLIESINMVSAEEFQKMLPQKSIIEIANDTVSEFDYVKKK